MINKIKWQASYLFTIMLALFLYLSATWFLYDSLKINLLVSNAVSFILMSLICLKFYLRSYKSHLKVNIKFVSFALFLILSSLLIDGYFVNFFVAVGRLAPLVSIFFAMIVSITFIIAFNLTFAKINKKDNFYD